MSIVLDVVQTIVLNGAYELTCAVAVQVYNKCKLMDAIGKCSVPRVKEIEKNETKNMIDIEVPDPPGNKLESKGSGKQLGVSRVVSQFDMGYVNSGPICPPKTSSMQLARNSYFS